MMKNFWSALPGSAVVLVAAGAANGQVIATQAGVIGQDALGSTVEEVQVTSTRIDRKGFVAPTPTTILTQADLRVGGANDLGSVLATLPSYAPTTSQATTRENVDTGQNTANLRDLGAVRTLVLIDGARPVATAPGGSSFGFDLNLVPFYLIDHVEIVTGGASAQWGSDAVAGVLNIVMKKSLDGFQADIQGGSDTEGYGSQTRNINASFGTSFAQGRGQLLIGLGYNDVKGVYPDYKSPSGNAGLIPNPNYTATNGQPQALFVQGLLTSTASTGGLINAGPLKGTNFGVGGSTSQFHYGTYGLNSTSGSLMVGGDPTASYNPNGSASLISPLVRETSYSRATYDVSDHFRLTADLLLGREESHGPFYDDFTNSTILNTNVYLPTQIASAMSADKITSFTLGRDDVDFGPLYEKVVNQTVQLKLGADGSFGQGWSWDSFYSYGQTNRNYSLGNQPITQNLTNAVNAIKSPTTGQPICAIALTNPSTTCVPIDLFGPNTATPATLQYILGTSVTKTVLYQHEVSANLRGEPFSLWAGPISVATGFEFREEGVRADADSITAAKGFTLNPAYLSDGSYTVGEVYLESVVPLARSLPLMKKLDLNGAVRVSDYSTSGAMDSWKVGLSDNVTDDLLFRATLSQDIRAPNLQEILTGQTTGLATVVNPLTNTAYSIQQHSGGNPSLSPESATTDTAGFTYQPHWVNGLSLSVDYYHIDVSNAIGTLSAQTIVNQCYSARIADACAEITTVNGAINTIQSTYINFNSYKAGGFDLEGDYRFKFAPFVPGQFAIRWLATYVNVLKETSGATVTRLAGDITNGVPRWRSVFTAKYDLDPVEVTARVRYVGGGAYTLVETVNTAVKGQEYLDLGVQWKLPVKYKISAYADVNNAFNNIYAVGAAANAGLFDYLGREFDVGLRLAF